jgi:hypothetical protein
MTRVSPVTRGPGSWSPVDGRSGQPDAVSRRSAARPGSPQETLSCRTVGSAGLLTRAHHYKWQNTHESVTSRSMSGALNVCETESGLCRLLPQVECLTLKSQPRYFVRIARKTGRDV